MLSTISNAIDRFNDKEGEITSMLIYPLLVIVIYEVFMRYVFNAPTSWGFEATTFLYGVHYMFGLAYTDVHDGHVKVDIFTARMSKRLQAIIGIFTLSAAAGMRIRPGMSSSPGWPAHSKPSMLMASTPIF